MSAIVIHLDGVKFHHATQLILDGISWEIQLGHKIGMVGPNGAGKSTLMQLIAGKLQADAGFINRHGAKIGYLEQAPHFESDFTVWEAMLSANEALQRIERNMRALEEQMGDPDVYGDEKRFNRVLARHTRATEDFENQSGYRYESLCRQSLHTVGFTPDDFNLPVTVLSGGQKKMLGLAKLLAVQCNVLLLDEPDNHLDVRGKEHLEKFIRGFDGTIIIVSHDRYLLDETVDWIAEVESRRLTIYQGNYAAYSTEKQLRLLKQQQAYAAQQKEISRIETAIARFELWAKMTEDPRHARQARSRQKMLERMDKIEKPVFEREKMGLALNGWRGSNKVLDIQNLDKAFDDNIILMGLDLLIWRGERVGLIGPNGCGKSVLFRCILEQEEPTGGMITVGPSVRIGYYAQEHQTLDAKRTLIEEIWDAKSMSEHAAVNFLRRFLFPYERARDTVSTLSGGERSRLQLAKLMLTDANFLLLDEPTNNLDLPSCDVLEQALDEFEGTVLVISHDRYFLDRIVTRIADMHEGSLTEYAGDYTYYAQQKRKGK